MRLPQRLVLDFHGLGRMPAHVESDEAFYWCEDLAVFEDILDAIPMVAANTGTPIEITFDDGNISDAVHATPALAKRGLTASFFVCAGRFSDPNYLGAEAMRDMLEAGMTIGSHGWSHIDWRTADPSLLRCEIDDAKACIEDTISRPIDAVAIPFGSYNRRVLQRLKNFATIYTSDGGLAFGERRYVPRHSYNRDWTKTTLHSLASQRDSAWERTRRSLVTAAKRLR